MSIDKNNPDGAILPPQDTDEGTRMIDTGEASPKSAFRPKLEPIPPSPQVKELPIRGDEKNAEAEAAFNKANSFKEFFEVIDKFGTFVNVNLISFDSDLEEDTSNKKIETWSQVKQKLALYYYVFFGLDSYQIADHRSFKKNVIRLGKAIEDLSEEEREKIKDNIKTILEDKHGLTPDIVNPEDGGSLHDFQNQTF